MQQVSNFILSSYSLLALAFLLSGHKSQVFRVYVLVHGLRFCVQGAYFRCIASCICVCGLCFVLSNWMDGNMNIIVLRLYPTRGFPNSVCLVANAWYNCLTRSVFGISPRERPSGKKWQALCHFGPADRTRGSRERPSGRQT